MKYLESIRANLKRFKVQKKSSSYTLKIKKKSQTLSLHIQMFPCFRQCTLENHVKDFGFIFNSECPLLFDFVSKYFIIYFL